MKKTGFAALSVLAVLLSANIAAAADNIRVVVNNEAVDFSGDQPPVIINGRTLVPFRAVFEKMGASVSWDSSAEVCSASLSGREVSIGIGSTAVYVNGKNTVTSDVPAQIINGRTMVPLRVLSESVGADVNWDASTKTVSVATAQTTSITEDKAKAIALADAGVTDASNVYVKLDRERYGNVYDVKFYSGSTEYEYEIDAATGKILSADREKADNIPLQPDTPSVSPSGTVTADDALQRALADAGLQKSQISRYKSERDFDDGRELYEIEFYYNGMEYSYEISASDGRILSKEIDRD